MATGGARHGRRDNGLHAAEYAAVADVDPRVGEHLLDVLAAGGIAAYLQPASDLNPVTRTTTVPARPTDRLYVDRAHLQTARGYVAKLAEGDDPAPTTASPDVDAEWAKLVASYHTEVDPAAHPWPAAEQVDFRPAQADEDKAGPERAERPASRPRTTGPDEPSLLDALDTFGTDLPDEPSDHERYVPPPPPPLPRISKYAVAGILAVVAGFGLFLFPGLLPVSVNTSMLLGFLGILAGFVTLIWRLRPGTDDDETDPDDGAVV